MKTKSNIVWNNTDWSVSNVEMEAQSQAILNASDSTNPGSTVSFPRRDVRTALVVAFEPRRDAAGTTGLETLLAYARRDAEALAWETGFADLFLPFLLEEKETAARDYWNHQQEVHTRSAEILAQFDPVPHRLAA